MKSARAKKTSTRIPHRITRITVSLTIAASLFTIPAASAADDGRIGLLRPIFNFGVEKITNALGTLRGVIGGGVFTKDKKAQDLEARRAVLVSVIELLIQEIEQSNIQLAQLSAARDDEKERMANALEENTLWFSSLLDDARRAQTTTMLQMLATDIKQYRDHRHTVLIRAIAELSLNEKQKRLLDLATARVANIARDIASLDKKAYDIDALNALLDNAEKNIEDARALIDDARDLLTTVVPPYEQKYIATIDRAHELLIKASVVLRDVYQLFVEMAKAVE